MRIDIDPQVVESVSREYAVVLGLSGGSALRIETLFELSEPGCAPIVIDPESPDADRKLERALLGRTVIRAIAGTSDGSLAMTLDGETSLRVPSDSDFEAWSVTHSDGRLVVALPGGGLARWGPRPS
ncbi:DUF6188 family protein [Microbacterium sp. LTA6]|uniref:DUF6188 family protein n=1 Tax=Microbacterium sp. LTA6 TaxID=3129771 RepID=UPI0032466008